MFPLRTRRHFAALASGTSVKAWAGNAAASVAVRIGYETEPVSASIQAASAGATVTAPAGKASDDPAVMVSGTPPRTSASRSVQVEEATVTAPLVRTGTPVRDGRTSGV